MAQGGVLLAVLAGVAFVWPRLVAWPLAVLSLWLGLALLARAARRRATAPPPRPPTAVGPPPPQ
jgi:cardiolipin synthase